MQAGKTMNGDAGRGRGRARWRPWMWGLAACLLLAPWLAMRLTDQVRWSGFDFAVFGGMLLVACSACELAAWRSRDPAYRAGFGLAVLSGFLLAWINLAVGIVGSEGNRANLLFFAVLAVGLAGALVARLRPRGMVHALRATALAQVLVALAVWPDEARVVVPLTVVFALLWLAAAWLFGRAARRVSRVR